MIGLVGRLDDLIKMMFSHMLLHLNHCHVPYELDEVGKIRYRSKILKVLNIHPNM